MMMKYLLLLAVLLVAYMLWRNARITQRGSRPPPDPAAPPAGPQDMVVCPVCSVHFPRPEGVAGSDGRLFCSSEHRMRAGV